MVGLEERPVDEHLLDQHRPTDGGGDLTPCRETILGLRREELENDGLELRRECRARACSAARSSRSERYREALRHRGRRAAAGR